MEAEKIFPELSESIETKVILTPDDFKKQLSVLQHSFGSISPIIGQKNLPYATPIKNLYHIGQFSESGAGAFGTAMGERKFALKLIKGKKHTAPKADRGVISHGF